jgi:hypothetical protein
MTRPADSPPRFASIFRKIAWLAFALLGACADRQDQAAAQAPLAASRAGAAQLGGVRFQAQAFEDGGRAAAAFGFDVRAAGLLPLRVSIDNQGGALRIVPRQTFLIDLDGQAWPLLTSGQAFDRLAAAGISAQGVPQAAWAEALDTLTGFALDVAVGSAAASTRPEAAVRLAFAARVPRNPAVPPGQAATGWLLFPGQGEARGVRGVRLCYEQDGRPRFLLLPLAAAPLPPPAP